MAGTIKGITIQFNGDTTKLDKALRSINNNTKSLDKELKQVNNALKFNPTSVELWAQKQTLLTQKVDETKKKLDVLKQAQAQMDAQGVDKTSAEYRDLERQIIVTENQVKNFEGQLKKIGNVKFKALSEEFKQVGTKLESAGQAMKGVSMAAAGVVASLGAVSYKAGVAADDLNTLSKITGIGTDQLQKYSYAADLVDVSVDSIAKANKKLTKNAYEAANGSKTQAEAFEAIGVSVKDSNGQLRDSEAIFQDVISALGTMTNETERDALAQTLMGKSAAELNPLIEDGGETYKRVADTLKKYNLDYVDQETLDKANEFNDEIDTLKLLGSVAFAQVGSQLAGYLAPALEKVVDLVGKFANWLSKLSPETLAIIGTIAAIVAGIAPLLLILGKLAFAISSIISLMGVIGPAFAALAGPVGIAIAAIAAIIAIGVALYKNWDTIKQKLSVLKDYIIGAWNKVKEALKTAAKAIFDALTWPYRKAWEIIKGVVDKIKSFFPIKIRDFFGKIKLPHFKIEGGFSLSPLSVPKIKIDWYKDGGIFSSPTIAGIGEAGSEAVVPLNKFWDKLDNIAAASGAPTISGAESERARDCERSRADIDSATETEGKRLWHYLTVLHSTTRTASTQAFTSRARLFSMLRKESSIWSKFRAETERLRLTTADSRTSRSLIPRAVSQTIYQIMRKKSPRSETFSRLVTHTND